MLCSGMDKMRALLRDKIQCYRHLYLMSHYPCCGGIKRTHEVALVCYGYSDGHKLVMQELRGQHYSGKGVIIRFICA